jgi:hypothetical protein
MPPAPPTDGGGSALFSWKGLAVAAGVVGVGYLTRNYWLPPLRRLVR